VVGRYSSTKSPRTTSPESKISRKDSLQAKPQTSPSATDKRDAQSGKAMPQTANPTHCKAGRLSPSSWPSPVGVARPPKKGPKALWGRATPTGEGQDGGLRPRALARAWRPSKVEQGRARSSKAEQGRARPSKAEQGQTCSPPPSLKPRPQQSPVTFGRAHQLLPLAVRDPESAPWGGDESRGQHQTAAHDHGLASLHLASRGLGSGSRSRTASPPR
jgi:hypothetical protein